MSAETQTRSDTRQKCDDILRSALSSIRALNKEAETKNDKYEPFIEDVCHRAAGILPWRTKKSKAQVALIYDAKRKQYTVAGGKAQGREHPLATAIRETREEAGHIMDKKKLAALTKTAVPCIYHDKGKYTLFLVTADQVGLEDVSSTANVIKWIDVDKAQTYKDKLVPFALELISQPGVSKWIASALAF